jgi:acetyl esterase/lipase
MRPLPKVPCGRGGLVKTINSTLLHKLLSTATLCWSGAALLCSLQIMLPARSFTLWLFTVAAKESSLLITASGLLGLVFATLVGLSGAPKRAAVAATLSVVAIALSLMPVVQAWRIASAEGVSLSLSEYLADLSPAAKRSPETIAYAHPDGEQLELDVWRPSERSAGVVGSRGRPAIVVVHGGGWGAGIRSTTPRWDIWLAEKGYVVFDIDYRLAPPPRWQDATGDVKCAVGWVKKNADRYDVDPDRVALVGFSAGGHLALLSAYSQDNGLLPSSCDVEDTGVSSVAAFYPPTDLKRLYSMEWPWSSPNVVGLSSTRRFLGGTPTTHPGRYRISSPINHVDPDDPSTFLVHGGADRLVPLEQSELLAKELQETGVPYRFVQLPWANHSFDHAINYSWRGWGAQITRSTLTEFLDNHVGAQSDPAVSDSGKRSSQR